MSTENTDLIAGAAPLDLAAYDPHFRISETTVLELDNLFEAMETMATISGSEAALDAVDYEAEHMAPIFAAFAALGKRLMQEGRANFSSQHTPRLAR